jgi:hypothetical protein
MPTDWAAHIRLVRSSGLTRLVRGLGQHFVSASFSRPNRRPKSLSRQVKSAEHQQGSESLQRKPIRALGHMLTRAAVGRASILTAQLTSAAS